MALTDKEAFKLALETIVEDIDEFSVICSSMDSLNLAFLTIGANWVKEDEQDECDRCGGFLHVSTGVPIPDESETWINNTIQEIHEYSEKINNFNFWLSCGCDKEFYEYDETLSEDENDKLETDFIPLSEQVRSKFDKAYDKRVKEYLKKKGDN